MNEDNPNSGGTIANQVAVAQASLNYKGRFVAQERPEAIARRTQPDPVATFSRRSQTEGID